MDDESPFPHRIFEDFWNDDTLRKIIAEFPAPSDEGWRRYSNGNELKLEGPSHLWGPTTIEFFGLLEKMAPEFGELFGVNDATLETAGGGYHLIPPGGYLKVHTDFNRSPVTGKFRVVNLLVFLNEDWDDPGGALELWDQEKCVQSITPEFNRTVLFATSSKSWHGHPKPASRWRRSVAAYLFSDIPPCGYTADQSTVFHPGTT